MIASFQHNFIFIKTRKVGGTSAEFALSVACGPKDIITPVSFEDEILRLKLTGAVLARNYAINVEVEKAYSESITKGADVRKDIPGWRRNRFYNHMPAREIAPAVGQSFWSSAFKFAIKRHPYEKVVSAAYHRLAIRGLPASEFARILNNKVRNLTNDDKTYMTDGALAVDELIRCETLEDDLQRIAAQWGVKLPSPLPRAKSSYRTDKRPAREILTDQQKQIVYDSCRSVFERMGYEP